MDVRSQSGGGAQPRGHAPRSRSAYLPTGAGTTTPPVTTVGFIAFDSRRDKLLALGAHFTLFGAAPSVAKA